MRRLTTEQYLEKARSVHGDTYTYDELVYRTARDMVIIHCREHGAFSQRAYCHTNGQGCPSCAHTVPLTGEQFADRSHEVHGDQYEVDAASFRGTKHPVRVRCSTHGWFDHPCAERHLMNDGGCRECAHAKRMEGLKPGNISKVEREWLDAIGVPLRQHRVMIDGKTYIVDGFDPENNVVYECYGSYWHGNPDVYALDDINLTLGVSFGSLFDKTMRREKVLREQGYSIVVKWV